MKKTLPLFFLLLPFIVTAQLYTVNNAMEYEDKANPTMEIFLTGAPTVTITYNGMANPPYQWYEFDSSGNSRLINGATSGTLTNAESDKGYYLSTDGNPTGKYVWIVDYSKETSQFETLTVPEESAGCDYVSLLFTDKAPDAYYYTPAGIAVPILRKYGVTYQTVNTEDYTTMEVTEELPASKRIPAPLTDTSFKVFDMYAQQLDIEVSIDSETYRAIAVHASATEEIEAREADNEISGEAGTYSAPMRATFTASSNEPVAAFFVWTVYKTDQSETDPIIRYTDKTLRHTFEESGTYRVSLDVSDRTSQCFYPTISFEYQIVESFIEVPNAFSPGASPGVNDEFKVAYRSLSKFKAVIINRWGQKLFEWTDPAQGWDGRFGGKLVPSGVYFYIIEWEGADGRKGVKKGDINILGGRNAAEKTKN